MIWWRLVLDFLSYKYKFLILFPQKNFYYFTNKFIKNKKNFYTKDFIKIFQIFGKDFKIFV